jgi:hypothetical protein
VFGAWNRAWRMNATTSKPGRMTRLRRSGLHEFQGLTGLVPLKTAHITELQQRAYDDIRSYVGVWLTIADGIIGSAGPFLLDTLWLGHR